MSDPNEKERKGENRWEPPSGMPRRSASEQLDTACDLLRVDRRRFLLYHLTEQGTDETTVEAAVGAVRAIDLDQAEEGSRPPRQVIRVELTNNHLPRLAAANVVDYDHRNGTVRYTGNDYLETLLERARRLELR